MKQLNRNAFQRCRDESLPRQNASCDSTRRRAFTLIELILVLALLVIITSLAAPAMANFIRGRAMDS